MISMQPTELKRVSRVRALAADGEARTMREAAGVSLREFAVALKTSPSTLSRWETGECKPGATAALKWADALAELTGEQV